MLNLLSNVQIYNKAILNFNGKTNSVKKENNNPQIHIIDNPEETFSLFNYTGNEGHDGKISSARVDEAIIKGVLPNADIKIHEYKPESRDGKNNFKRNVEKNLKEVINSVNSGEKAQSASLSATQDIPFFVISTLMGKEINGDNLAENKEEILNKLVKSDINEKEILKNMKPDEILENSDKFLTEKEKQKLDNLSSPKEKYKFCKDKMAQYLHQIHNSSNALKYLAELHSLNIPVYVDAGKSGKNYFNLLGLAEGVKVVSTDNEEGHAAAFSSENSTVNAHGKGEFGVYSIVRDGELKGYNITPNEKQKIDLPAGEFQDLAAIKKFDRKHYSSVLATQGEQKEFDKLEKMRKEDPSNIQQALDELDKSGKLEKMKDKLFDTGRQGEYTGPIGRIYTNFDKTAFFTIGTDDIIYSASDHKDRVGTLKSTGFAAPSALARDIKELTQKGNN